MIAEFYKDSEIFITGGSGVVGKAAIEKLLRSSDVKKIYMLLRPKKDQGIEQRMEKVKKSKIFRVLNNERPYALNKLVAIPGDAALPNLGITLKYAKLMENVSIFFHCAATVRFNESLKIAIILNVGGTWEALKFAETLKKLKVFVHVSTFFSNPYLHNVEPKLYSSPVNWKFFLNMVQDDSRQDILITLTKKIITGFPNTYCFTKNLSESVVESFRGRLPVAIFRPSIVVFAANEPEPGFPATQLGAMGLFTLVGAGILKCVHIKSDMILDFTPLDLGTIVMLTHAVLAAKQYEAGNVCKIPVSICTSRGIIPFTFNEWGQIIQEKSIWEKFAFEKNFLIPWVYQVSNDSLYTLLVFFYQVIPAILGDRLLRLFGQKPEIMNVMRRAYNELEIMKPFLFNDYKCEGITNLKEIRDITDGTEFSIKEIINIFDITPSSSDKFMETMVSQIRKVLLNENPSSLERSKKILKAKKVVYNILRGILAYYLLRWFYMKFF